MRTLLFGILAALVLLLGVGVALPPTHRIVVSAEIDAPAATVFAQLNDLRRYALWAIRLDSDANARLVFPGNRTGVGAAMSWDGPVLGSGTMMITDSVPQQRVRMQINAGEPGEALASFQLEPGTGTTIVTWRFEIDYGMNIVGRYFAGLLGRVIARDNQQSLANLKELAENLPPDDFGDLDIEHVDVEAEQIAYLRVTSSPQSGAVAETMREAYFDILTFIDGEGLTEAGPPLAITRSFSGSTLTFDAGIPVRGVDESTSREGSGVRIAATYAGPAIRVRHVGSYESLAATHRKISAYLTAYGIERNGAFWESYTSDPSLVPEGELETLVYYPIGPAE